MILKAEKPTKIVFMLLAVMLVSGCANTWDGVKHTWQGMKRDYEAMDRQAIGYSQINQESGFAAPRSHRPWYGEEGKKKPIPTSTTSDGRVILTPPPEKPGTVSSSPMMTQRIVVGEDGRVQVVKTHPAPPHKPSMSGAGSPEDMAEGWSGPVMLFDLERESPAVPSATIPARMPPVASSVQPPPEKPLPQFEPVQAFPPPAQGLPPEVAASYGVLNNRNVTVFPVEEDYYPYQTGGVYEGLGDYQVISGAGVTNQPYQPVSYTSVRPDETIFFAHNSVRLGTIDKKKIKTVAQKALGLNNGVRVIGHASKRVAPGLTPAQRAAVNLEISSKRAAVVAEQLKKDGVTPDWVEATAQGDTVPNPDSGGKSQEAANRRVEIYLENR